MIIIVVIFALIAMIAVSSLVGYTMLQIRLQRQAVAQTMGVSIAEAGAELAIWKLNNQSGYTGESGTSYGGGVYNITITNTGSGKLVKAEAFVPDVATARAKRVVQITVSNGSKNIGFNYGVQVGVGGLLMDNNSSVAGNVYSNSNVTGSGTITGTAIAGGASGTISGVTVSAGASAHNVTNATVTGNVNTFALSGGTVTGNVSASSVANCTINGNAVYNTKSSCSITGTETTPNNNVPADPTIQPLPIDQTQINAWITDATNGGTVGNQTISGSVSLGPKKINGNLTLNNNSTLTVTGTLWVTGAITFNNNSTLQLSSSYGSLSGVVIAGTSGSSSAGVINAQNGSTISGSGTAGSYVLLLSQRDDPTNTAISVANNAAGAIFYAGTGVINLYNNSTIKEATAEKIYMNPNAILTYASGLASAQFSSGPAGGWEFLVGTWQLLQ